ncbi:MAG: molybdenum cofactor biosynthesis protein B [Methylococcales bacterium]|nr:molybdenum cofactor biosynthesis protein B [Methylococcales bacterium]
MTMPAKTLNIALATVSDTRTLANDRSGTLLYERLNAAGHRLHERALVADNIYQIRALLAPWIANPAIDVIMTTGGTGVTGRDGTPEAALPLLDKVLDGFGELFRTLSYQSIGTSSLQSRALAGVANGTYLFCLPGSPDACATAWDQLINAQLDSRTQPCNLVQLMPRLMEGA